MGAMKSRSPLSYRTWLAPAALALLCFTSAARVAAPPIAPRTVILLRHAEKADDDPRDPTLSAAGAERAEALARLLARARPARLIASEFRRTQATLAPLAEDLGLRVETIAAGKADELVRAVDAADPGTTLVIAGHSNTVPLIAARLGAPLPDLEAGKDGPVLREGEHDRVFVLTLPPRESGAAPAVLELRYGR
jgi:phosphohistidine phosphatase SixA